MFILGFSLTDFAGLMNGARVDGRQIEVRLDRVLWWSVRMFQLIWTFCWSVSNITDFNLFEMLYPRTTFQVDWFAWLFFFILKSFISPSIMDTRLICLLSWNGVTCAVWCCRLLEQLIIIPSVGVLWNAGAYYRLDFATIWAKFSVDILLFSLKNQEFVEGQLKTKNIV